MRHRRKTNVTTTIIYTSNECRSLSLCFRKLPHSLRRTVRKHFQLACLPNALRIQHYKDRKYFHTNKQHPRRGYCKVFFCGERSSPLSDDGLSGRRVRKVPRHATDSLRRHPGHRAEGGGALRGKHGHAAAWYGHTGRNHSCMDEIFQKSLKKQTPKTLPSPHTGNRKPGGVSLRSAVSDRIIRASRRDPGINIGKICQYTKSSDAANAKSPTKRLPGPRPTVRKAACRNRHRTKHPVLRAESVCSGDLPAGTAKRRRRTA